MTAGESNSHIRVFIVEDHPVMLKSLRDFVDMQPDMVVVGVATSAEEVADGFGLDLPPDVAMIDLSLPGMSGDRLVQILRKSNPSVVSIIVSGHDEEIYAESAERAGAFRYVMKDVPEKIIEVVREAAGSKPRKAV